MARAPWSPRSLAATPAARRAGLAALALVAALAPLIDRDASHVGFLTDAAVFLTLALGLNVVVGYAGLLDLGYAAFFAIGSYTYAFLASPQLGLHWPFWAVLPAAAAITALFGVLLGAPTLRLRGDYLAIVTLGFGEIVPQTFLNLRAYTNGPDGIGALDAPTLFGRSFGYAATPFYETALALAIATLLLSRNLRRSRIGRAWTAMREDELAAAYAGVDVAATKLRAFAVGAGIAGAAGVVYAAKLSLVSPDQFRFSVSVFTLSMLVLGGMGSLPGVVVGSLALSTLSDVLLPQATNIARSLGYPIDFTNVRLMLYGGILIAVMLLRPQGLWPERTRAEELAGALADPDLARAERATGTGA